MAIEADVYNAAREGKILQLRMFLESHTKDEMSKLVNSKTNGATPLIMACRNGHISVAEFLVNKCEAEIEQVGSVTFDGEVIDGAPPLWCAAAAGHIGIVKFLIKCGAAVNNTTYTNSTPLRAACFDGHFEVVQYLVEHHADIEIANRHGHTCLMISCYKGHYKIVKFLIEKGADVNRKSLKGNTALHDCAESGFLDIMKLLLCHCASMDKDSYGMTPLLAAAVTGHTKTVEFLIYRNDCTKAEKIDALELIGATYVDKKRDMMGALKFWKLAMQERLVDPKCCLLKPTLVTPIAAYEHAVEACTLEELEDLISDPDDMRMQALLVRERILGPAHPDTSYYIRYRGAVYADMGNFDRCILLWMYALEMQQKILEPLSPMTQSSFLSFAELFSFMMAEGRNKRPYPVNFADMLVVYEKAVIELEKGMSFLAKTPACDRDSSHFNRMLVILMHLTCLILRCIATASKDHEHGFKKLAYRFVQMNPEGARGFTPLHLACSKDTTTVGRYPVCAFPSDEVVNLLLDVGASVNVMDLDNNTPLHIAVANKPSKPSCQAVIASLLNRGAHIDACNLKQVSPVEMLSENSDNSIYSITQYSPLKYLSLQCLAAKSLKEHNIPYKGKVTQKLESFIRLH